MEELIRQAFQGHRHALEWLETQTVILNDVAACCVRTLESGGKIIFMGNGGSAADAQHLAAEFVGRFQKDRKPLAAISLATDTSVITAIGNDFGFQEVFARQIAALAAPNDLVVGISTSGKSANVVRGFQEAKRVGARTVGLLGNDGGVMRSQVDIALVVPSRHTPHIQEMHTLAGHIVCGLVDAHISQVQ